MDIIGQLRSSGVHLWNNRSDANGSALTNTDAYRQAKAHIEAILLIELGARSPLVCRLTKLPRATVKQLYRRIHGRPSPAGQGPFTDAWYLQNGEHMLHANIVWRLNEALEGLKREPSERLINLYEMYVITVDEPLLDVAHVELVPRLLKAGIWLTHSCASCGDYYVSPVTDIENVCPACAMQHLYRCPDCNSALKPHEVGRRVEHCPQCGKRLHHLAS
jgi:DNA-directed RNA polymerase subunit RPC12/RpoP